MRRLDNAYKANKTANILVIYQKEPHPGQMAFAKIGQPTSTPERIKLAKKMVDELEVTSITLVDTMTDSSRLLFSDLPSPVFILDSKGVVQEKFAWPVITKIDNAVKRVIAEEKIAKDPSAITKQKQILLSRLFHSVQKQYTMDRWPMTLTVPNQSPVAQTGRLAISAAKVSLGSKERISSKAISQMIISKFPLPQKELDWDRPRFKDYSVLFVEKAGLHENDGRYFFNSEPKVIMASEHIVFGIKPLRMKDTDVGLFKLKALYLSKKHSFTKAEAKEIYREQILQSISLAKGKKELPFVVPAKDRYGSVRINELSRKGRICFEVEFTIEAKVQEVKK